MTGRNLGVEEQLQRYADALDPALPGGIATPPRRTYTLVWAAAIAACLAAIGIYWSARPDPITVQTLDTATAAAPSNALTPSALTPAPGPLTPTPLVPRLVTPIPATPSPATPDAEASAAVTPSARPLTQADYRTTSLNRSWWPADAPLLNLPAGLSAGLLSWRDGTDDALETVALYLDATFAGWRSLVGQTEVDSWSNEADAGAISELVVNLEDFAGRRIGWIQLGWDPGAERFTVLEVVTEGADVRLDEGVDGLLTGSVSSTSSGSIAITGWRADSGNASMVEALPPQDMRVEANKPIEVTIDWSGDELRAIARSESGDLIGFASYVPAALQLASDYVDFEAFDTTGIQPGYEWLEEQSIPVLIGRFDEIDAPEAAERYFDLAFPDWRQLDASVASVTETHSPEGRLQSSTVGLTKADGSNLATLRMRSGDGSYIPHDVRSPGLDVQLRTVSAGLRGIVVSEASGTLLIQLARSQGEGNDPVVTGSYTADLTAGVAVELSIPGHEQELRARFYNVAGELVGLAAYQPMAGARLTSFAPGSVNPAFVAPLDRAADLEERLMSSGLVADWAIRNEWQSAPLLGVDIDPLDPYASLTKVLVQVLFNDAVSGPQAQSFVDQLIADGLIDRRSDISVATPRGEPQAGPFIVDTLPPATRCTPAPGNASPQVPRGGGIVGLVSATPEEADAAFRGHSSAPRVAGTFRRTFVNPAGETIGFAWGYPEPASFLLVVEVARVEGGWTVTRWESTGC